MFTHSNLARLFLLGLGGIGLYLALFGSPEGGVALVPCPFRAVTGIRCPGCGMTRSCLALVQGVFISAWTLHPFSFLLVTLAVPAAFFPASARGFRDRFSPTVRNVVMVGLVALCLGLWIYRLFV